MHQKSVIERPITTSTERPITDFTLKMRPKGGQAVDRGHYTSFDNAAVITSPCNCAPEGSKTYKPLVDTYGIVSGHLHLEVTYDKPRPGHYPRL